MRVDADQVHELQGGEVLGPQFGGNVRPLLAFGDVRVTGQRDYQQVALTSGEL
jgi:hypothetical protein